MKTLSKIFFAIIFSLGLAGSGWAQVATSITFQEVLSVETFGSSNKTEVKIEGDDLTRTRDVIIKKDSDYNHPAINHCKNYAVKVSNSPNKWDLLITGSSDGNATAGFNLDNSNHSVRCKLLRER